MSLLTVGMRFICSVSSNATSKKENCPKIYGLLNTHNLSDEDIYKNIAEQYAYKRYVHSAPEDTFFINIQAFDENWIPILEKKRLKVMFYMEVKCIAEILENKHE